MKITEDITKMPSIEDFIMTIHNPIFEQFYTYMLNTYHPQCKIEFSKDVYFKGWNLKFRKAGKSLCVVYPKDNYFIVLVVIGRKEKEKVEQLLSTFHERTKSIYYETKEGNQQRWLMIPLTNEDAVYEDVLQLIRIRRECK